MQPEYLQLGATFFLAISLIELVKFIVSKYAHKNNGNGLTKQVQIIAENDLKHILAAIEKQTDDNNEWHRKQYEILCEIKGKL